MTIQMMIEADTHEAFVEKLQGIAVALGSTERVETKGSDYPALDIGERPDTPENRQVDAAADQQQAAEAASTTGGIPNPTKATVALAEEKGVDLADVKGTGKNGRVTQADVKAHAAASAPQEDPAPEPEAPAPADTPAADPFSEGEEPVMQTEATSIEPTAENTTAALKAVNAEKGMDVCVEILGEYGCRRVSEVPAESRPAFIEFCANRLNIGTGELASRIAAA